MNHLVKVPFLPKLASGGKAYTLVLDLDEWRRLQVNRVRRRRELRRYALEEVISFVAMPLDVRSEGVHIVAQLRSPFLGPLHALEAVLPLYPGQET